MSARGRLTELVASSADAASVAQLHAALLRSGLLAAADCFFATCLASAYAKLGRVDSSRKLFDETSRPNIFLCNATLRAHSRSRQWPEALRLFSRMRSSPHLFGAPDEFTLSLALRSCAALSELRHGRAVHGLVIKSRKARSDVFVGSALVEMYSKSGEMADAVALFEELPERDVVLWTAVVTGYQHNGFSEEAVTFFTEMVVEERVVPDPVTLVSVVSAIAQLGDLRAGRSCHGFLVRMGFEHDMSLMNAILNMYAKVGTAETTARLFDTMLRRDVISWSCMISCYSQNGYPDEALITYKRMSSAGLEPNSITLVCVLQACALALDLDEGRKAHQVARYKGYVSELSVSTALIDMYMKCSCCKEAMDVFHQMPKKDVVSWAAVIGGYAQNCSADEALRAFQNMLSEQCNPDAVTMAKVLAACTLMGILPLALCYHGYLVSSGFDRKAYVMAALVDLYSKSGSLDNAIKVFESTDEKDVVLWSCMIAAYGMHGLGHKAIATYEHMIQLSIRPNAVTFMSILSACSHSGLIAEGRRIFDSMSDVHNVTPNSQHYGIIVDLLGRSGELQEAMRVIEVMPGAVGPRIWCTLLAACLTHQNIDMAEVVTKKLMELGPKHAGYYILLSNIYASQGKWDQMEGVKKLIEDSGMSKVPGLSSVFL